MPFARKHTRSIVQQNYNQSSDLTELKDGNAQMMNYEEYQRQAQHKLDIQGGEQLPASIPGGNNPMVPMPKPIVENIGIDDAGDEETRKNLLRHEAILVGKKRFREIRTNLGVDLQNYKAPNLTFLQKLNNLISAQMAYGDQNRMTDSAKDAKPVRLMFPFKNPNASKQLWNQEGTDKVCYSGMRRMKRRIEKEVLKQEMQFHHQQQEVKIKALEAIIKMQQERLTRLQRQFDTSMSQMVKILVNQDVEDDEEDVAPAQT